MLSQRKMLDSFGDQNLFVFPTEIHVRGQKDRDYHCDRYTPLNTLDITIITTV